MRISKCIAWTVTGAMAIGAVACGDDPSPTQPTPSAVNITAPSIGTPSDNEQTDTLRPTLTVRNATADQTGTRVYEFQISDSSSFASSASNVPGYAASVSKAGVPEGAGGTTELYTGPGPAADDAVLLESARCAGSPTGCGRRPPGSSRSWWASTGPTNSTIR